jgi:hypothetical protein
MGIQEKLNRLRDKKAAVARAIAAVQYLKLEYRDSERQLPVVRGEHAQGRKVRKSG